MRFSIKAPLLYMTKGDIIKTGHQLGLDYSLTWSCYDPQPGEGGREDMRTLFVPCGACDSCRFREKGSGSGVSKTRWPYNGEDRII